MNYSDYADKGQAQVMSLLKEKLSAKQWREADELTKILMLKTSNKKKGSYLSLNIDDFPNDVLAEIDWLWRMHSLYRFGFSVQKDIFNSKSYSGFISKVGWHKEDSWLSYSDLSFTENAPKGHLPYCGWHFWQSVYVNKGSSSKGSSSSHKTHFHRPHYHPPHRSHSHSDNNAGAAAGFGALAAAAAPWLIGAAVVGGAGYLVYREATKGERRKKERLEKERQEQEKEQRLLEEKQRLLEEENRIEQNIGSLLALAGLTKLRYI
ncbi:MAG: GUN4 domain-containing protein [Trichodesmium sp. MO_231.B1]|nr:GUN4 domain-containing protein [Trichodesmium sp. MO_231.B1]